MSLVLDEFKAPNALSDAQVAALAANPTGPPKDPLELPNFSTQNFLHRIKTARIHSLLQTLKAWLLRNQISIPDAFM